MVFKFLWDLRTVETSISIEVYGGDRELYELLNTLETMWI